MKVHWAVLCRRAIIDSSNNVISLIDILEEAVLPEAPPEISPDVPRMFTISEGTQLVVLWARTDPEIAEERRGRFRLRLPSGRFVPTADDQDYESSVFVVDLAKFLRLRLLISIPGIPYERPGIYTFVLEEEFADGEWTALFEVPVSISIQSGVSSGG